MTDNPRAALISIGSNEESLFGDAAETVQKASKILGKMSETPALCSAFYKNPAFPKGAGPDFVNAAMVIFTFLSPDAILAELHTIEAAALRQRTQRWGQRTLDLDLIGIDDVVLPDRAVHDHWRLLSEDAQLSTAPDALILPHPRMQDRAFVLVPLCDVAPDWVHPVLGRSVRQMCDALPANDVAEVVRLSQER